MSYLTDGWTDSEENHILWRASEYRSFTFDLIILD